ncbi:MAG: hypothetical protein JWM17_2097 [Actinobacteria bacterium]|nr:hypothetical protein [Actinomycetota bacterium]
MLLEDAAPEVSSAVRATSVRSDPGPGSRRTPRLRNLLGAPGPQTFGCRTAAQRVPATGGHRLGYLR